MLGKDMYYLPEKSANIFNNTQQYINSLTKHEKYNICMYSLNDKRYVEYYLTRETDKSKPLLFPVYREKGVLHTMSLNGCFSNMCNILGKSYSSREIKEKMFKGIHKFNGEAYLFFNITAYLEELKYGSFSTNYISCIIDEIVNVREIYGQQIEKNITNLFLTNPELCMVFDENNALCEIPMIVYDYVEYGIKYCLEFGKIYGFSRTNEYAIQQLCSGQNREIIKILDAIAPTKHLYFVSYSRANHMKQKYSPAYDGRIMRFVLFSENTLIPNKHTETSQYLWDTLIINDVFIVKHLSQHHPLDCE